MWAICPCYLLGSRCAVEFMAKGMNWALLRHGASRTVHAKAKAWDLQTKRVPKSCLYIIAVVVSWQSI